ncbi:MAG: 2-hydroxychromene-2-carboxylate isomerase [Pseudomonadota bacterium]
MTTIVFHFDFISPYAYLAFEKLPEALRGLSYSVQYRPVLFGAVLKHHGQLGPAEIPAKRDWTYRQVLWLAQSLGIELQMPASHPFNSLALMRLALAAAPPDEPSSPNRHVCETLFRHIWQGGAEAADPARIESLRETLKLSLEAAGRDEDAVKAQLKANTEEAIARGVFGVPTFEVDGKMFWGLDALPMLRGYLLGEPWFEGPAWNSVTAVSTGVVRRR